MRTATAPSTGSTHPANCSCAADPAEWYANYAEMIRQYLAKRLPDYQTAEECTNETFLRAMTRRDRFQCGGLGVRPWLYTIARNLALDFHKQAHRRRETPVAAIIDGAIAEPTPEQWAVRRATLVELAHHLERLPHDQAVCVRLRFFADLSVEQTARAMHRKAGAVRALQFRAVRSLAASLSTPPSAHPSGRRWQAA